MSTFKVSVVTIASVMPHPNADRLDLVTLVGMDWQTVVQKGRYTPGSRVLYLPIDSLLPAELEAKIFGGDSKIKLHNSRIRTIKLRGAVSQGMVVDLSLFPEHNQFSDWGNTDGDDLAKTLGITKYEPPVKLSSASNSNATSKKQTNPHFRKYTGIENAKNYSNVFLDTDEVVVTEKIHGSNFRCGWVPFHANTLWRKIKVFLGIAPQYDFVYGSHNVQLQDKLLYSGYYDTNVYAETVMKYSLRMVLKKDEVVYGEIYGDGIQKGYTYGCKTGERKLVVFDVMINGQYLDPIAFKKWAEARQLPTAPQLYVGPFNKEKILALRDGDSVLAPSQKVREGVVVRSIKEEISWIGRKMLKFISDDYLLKNQDLETLPH